jgi:hypothetical protein
MSESEGTKVVGLDFTVKGQATEQAERMAKSFDHVHGAVEKATGKMHAFGRSTAVSALGAIGLSFGFREIASKAMEANREIEGSSKKLAGMQYAFGNWRAGISVQERWNASLEEGREIVDRLDESEGKLKIDRAELADIYKSTTALSERYGLSMEDQLALTEKLGAVQKVLGVNAEAANMQITRMAMTGNLRGFDDFSKSMRFAIGNLKQFAKLSETERFKKIQKAMGDLVPAAEAMGKGIGGSMFDISQAVEDITRDVSSPVIKEVGKELSTWAKHLTTAKENGKSLTQEIGGKLVTAFGYLKGVTSYIADNWQALALVFGATKAAGAMQGLAAWGKGGGDGKTTAGGASAVGAMTVNAAAVHINQTAAASLGATVGKDASKAIGTSLKPTLSETVGHLAGMAAKVGIVTEALGGMYLGMTALVQWIDSSQTDSLKRQGVSARTMSSVSAYTKAVGALEDSQTMPKFRGSAKLWADAAYMHLQNAFGAYGLKPGQQVSAATIAQDLKAMGPELAAQTIAKLGLKGDETEAARFIARDLNVLAEKLLGAYPDLGKTTPDKLTGKRDIKIDVHHLEITQDFKQADPDRVFHRIPNQIAEMVFAPHASNLPMVPE